ncbi:MAG: hypothetical protein HYX73_08460 [Acidobacteria bacterium]|nr:hypothetical protein [Acidobacteriota bacterium]
MNTQSFVKKILFLAGLAAAMLLLTPRVGLAQTGVFNLSTAPTLVANTGVSELLGQVTLTADSVCGTAADGFCKSGAGTLQVLYINTPINPSCTVCETVSMVSTCNAPGTYLTGSVTVTNTFSGGVVSFGVKAGVDFAAGDQISISGIYGRIYQSPGYIPGTSLIAQMTVSPSTIAAFVPTSQVVAISFTNQSAITSISGNSQSATVGMPLAQPFVVGVTAPMGSPAAGVLVTFAVISGGGSLSATEVVTGADGQASSILTVGPVTGFNRVSASSPGIPGSPVLFTAAGVLILSLDSGNNQTALVGAPLASALTVRASGAINEPVPGIPIDFEVTSGGGSFSTPAHTTTNGQGVASVSLTLGLIPGTTTVKASSPNAPASVITFTATAIQSQPTPSISSGGIVNGASFLPATDPNGKVTPGGIVSVSGSDLGAAAVVASTLPLPTTLGDTSVTFNGIVSPLFFVSPGQVYIQLPFSVPTGEATVVVRRGDTPSAPQVIQLASVSPGIFTLDGAGTGRGAILHTETLQPVTETNPAHPEEVLIIYCTGLGKLRTGVDSGTPSPSPPPETVETPMVTIAGIPAEVLFSGLAAGYVGLYEVKVTVPAGVPAGTQNLRIVMADVPSNTVTVAVQ